MNKKFDAVPKRVQDDIDNMRVKLNAITTTHKVEVIGYWIWVGETEKSNKDAYKNLGFRWSSNKEKWYWAHPQSPKSKRRRTRGRPKSMPQNQVRDRYKHTNVSNTSAESTSPKKLSERETLEQELERLQSAMQRDSGENHINFMKMIGDVNVKIQKLDDDAKQVESSETETAKAQEQEEAHPKQDARSTLRGLFS